MSVEYRTYSVIADRIRNVIIITDKIKRTPLSVVMTPNSWYQNSHRNKVKFEIAHTYYTLARNTTTDLLTFIRKNPDIKIINKTNLIFQ